MNEFEKKFIKRVLDRSNGNQSRAARLLGIHRNTLSRKIGIYKLDHRPHRAPRLKLWVVIGRKMRTAPGCRAALQLPSFRSLVQFIPS